MARFLPIDRDSVYPFPSSVQDRLTETPVAFRYLACNRHPDHDSRLNELRFEYVAIGRKV